MNVKRQVDQGNFRSSRRCKEVIHDSDTLMTSPQLYDKQFPTFREPVEVGSFSHDCKRQLHNDRHQLKKYVPPANPEKCKFDLRHGYNNMIRKDENTKDYIDGLLFWIVRNKDKFLTHKPSTQPLQGKTKTAEEKSAASCMQKETFTSLSTDFVCWRGLLTRLLCAPYENRDDLLVAVIRFRGTYFMCEFETEAKKLEKEQTTARQTEMCAWGFKFEQYVTAEPGAEGPDTSRPVDTNAAFCSIARSRLESHSLVYGAEVDCEHQTGQKGNKYIELKTSRIIESQRQYDNFCKFKLIKWWAQSFLIGIPLIVCGFRDDNGVVRRTEDFPVLNIPSTASSTLPNPWKPTICFNFLNTFLNFVKAKVTEDKERCAYLFHLQPGSDVTYENAGMNPEFQFLPEWFIHWEGWDS